MRALTHLPSSPRHLIRSRPPLIRTISRSGHVKPSRSIIQEIKTFDQDISVWMQRLINYPRPHPITQQEYEEEQSEILKKPLIPLINGFTQWTSPNVLSSENRDTCINHILTHFLNFLMSIEIKDITDIDFEVYYSHIDEYCEMFALFRRILPLLPDCRRCQYFTPKVFSHMIEQLKIKNSKAQNAVLNTLVSIVSMCPTYGEVLERKLEEKLLDVCLSNSWAHAVTAMIELQNSLFSFYKSATKHSILAALLNHRGIPEFDLHLTKLILFSDQIDHRSVQFAISYMARNWPVTNWKKSASFIKILIVLLKTGYGISNLKLSKRLTWNLIGEIKSSATETSTLAIRLLTEPQFFKLMGSGLSAYRKQFKEALTLATTHWSPDVAAVAFVALNNVNESNLCSNEKPHSGLWRGLSVRHGIPLTTLVGDDCE